jgi:hypothetical protein
MGPLQFYEMAKAALDLVFDRGTLDLSREEVVATMRRVAPAATDDEMAAAAAAVLDAIRESRGPLH